MHCWHQAVRVRPAGPGDRHGDIAVDTGQAHEIYQRWLLQTRPAGQVSPDGTRRPGWLMRPLKPAAAGLRDPGDGGRSVTVTDLRRDGSCSARWAPDRRPGRRQDRVGRPGLGGTGQRRAHRGVRPQLPALRRGVPGRRGRPRRRCRRPGRRVLAGHRHRAARRAGPPGSPCSACTRPRRGGRRRPPTPTADALTRARQALFWEHLWPWLPGYLDAVADLGAPGLTPWARLARRTLQAERDAHPGGWLPLALRAAPAPGPAADGLDALLDLLTAPVRSGFILTRRRLAAGARGGGRRPPDRRTALHPAGHAGTGPGRHRELAGRRGCALVPAARRPAPRSRRWPAATRHHPGLVGSAGGPDRSHPGQDRRGYKRGLCPGARVEWCR